MINGLMDGWLPDDLFDQQEWEAAQELKHEEQENNHDDES